MDRLASMVSGDMWLTLASKLDCVMEYWEYTVSDRRILVGVEHEGKNIRGLMVREFEVDGSTTYSISGPALFLIIDTLNKGQYTVPLPNISTNPLPT